ncbi:unnamed protein product [Tetraodon nigroviridis]|uniref:(spotted green pufferfish) hypothetical protein n=1 Tax=Tetraodon nigroviridis TaxID=99883 RepID=Q4THX0_TETNG|nr:unnamed protein product [Tetraodon nigroviridis]
MFSLQLLALIFFSTPEDVKKGRRQGEGREEEKLRRGDLLVVPRTLFTHFGIYLGGDRVAHFIPDVMPVVSSDKGRIAQMVTNTRLLLGVLAKRGSVRVDSVEDFAYGSKILVNTPDKVCSRPALPGDEVARRAEQLRGHMTYSLLWYNCEHFVMYCRYGTVVSFQTFQFCKTARQLLLSRTVAKATAMLGGCLLLSAGALTTSSAVPVVLLPFLIWMAS